MALVGGVVLGVALAFVGIAAARTAATILAIAATFVAMALVAAGLVAAGLVAGLARLGLVGAVALAPLGSSLELLLIVFLVAGVVAAFAALAPLLFEAGPVLVQDPIIMVGELKVIFGLAPVALHLHVAGEALIFF